MPSAGSTAGFRKPTIRITNVGITREKVGGGPDNYLTNRKTTFMTWNPLHLARLIVDAGGFSAHGDQRSKWDAGCRFDHPNPDDR
jgi:hypothetical protein